MSQNSHHNQHSEAIALALPAEELETSCNVAAASSIKAPVQPVRSWFNVSLMSLSHFTSDFYGGFLPVLLPIIAIRYDISYSQSAAIYMVFSVAMNLLQPPVGIVADRRNINYMMPLSIITSGLLASTIIFSPNLWVLLLIVLLCGVCISGFHPISAGILTRVIPAERNGLGTSVYIAGGNLGFSIAPLCAGAVIDYLGEPYLALLAIPAVVTTLLIYKQHLHTPSLERKVTQADSNFLKVIISKPFIALNVAIGLRSWGYCAFIVFIPILFSEKGYSSFEGAACLVVMLIGAVVGGLICGAFSDHFGPKKVILASFVVSVLTGSAFLFYSDMSLVALVSLFIYGAALYGSTPSAIVWTQRLLPNYAGFAASLTLGMGFGVGYICCLITGWIGDNYGLQEAMLYSIVFALIAAVVCIALLREPQVLSEDKMQQIKDKALQELAQDSSSAEK